MIYAAKEDIAPYVIVHFIGVPRQPALDIVHRAMSIMTIDPMIMHRILYDGIVILDSIRVPVSCILSAFSSYN